MPLTLRPGVRVCLTLNGVSCDVPPDALEALLHDPAQVSPEVLRTLFTGGFVTAQPIADALAQRVEPATPAHTQWTLASALQLTVSFDVGGAELTTVDPAVGVFVSRDALTAAQDLHAELRDIVTTAALDAVARDAPLPRARLQALLEERVQRHHAAFPLAVASHALESRSAAAASVSFAIRCGAKTRVVRVPLGTLPAAHRLLAALARGEGVAPHPDIAGAAPLWAALHAVEGVSVPSAGPVDAHSATDALPRDVDATDALVVTHLGHAGVAVDAPMRRVLIDPVLYPEHEDNAWPVVTARALGTIAALFLTHQHTDHLDPATLLQLDPAIPIYVPAGGVVPLAQFLAQFGFTHVHALAPGDTVDIGDGMRVHALPFYGEASERTGFCGLTFAVSRNGRGVLLHADASPNHAGASLLSTSALEELRARGTAIDAVFGTWWQQRQLALMVAPAALQLVPAAEWLHATESCDCPPEFLAGLVQRSGAQLFVTYAESGHELFLPPHARSAYIPMMALLWRALDDVRAELHARTGVPLVEAQPYLRVRIQADGAPPVVDSSEVRARRRA